MILGSGPVSNESFDNVATWAAQASRWGGSSDAFGRFNLVPHLPPTIGDLQRMLRRTAKRLDWLDACRYASVSTRWFGWFWSSFEEERK